MKTSILVFFTLCLCVSTNCASPNPDIDDTRERANSLLGFSCEQNPDHPSCVIESFRQKRRVPTRVTETVQQRTRPFIGRTYLPPEPTTRAPTTPYASPWPSNQDLRKQISEAILKFGENLPVSDYQGFMDASKDLYNHFQYWNSTQMLSLAPIIGHAIVSQATIHNSSKAKSSLIYDEEIQQNITRSFQKYVPNMPSDDIQFMINTLQTISKIAVKSLTLDELTKMSKATASAFTNNTLVNGPVTTPRPKFIPTTQPNTYLPPDTTKTTSRIEKRVPTRPSTTRVTETIQQRRTTLPRTYLPPETVTIFSCANAENRNNPRCTTTTRAPTTPYASPWPSNQALRKQISKAILESAGNLSVSDYQVLMDTSKDLYNHFQYWNSTQMLSLAPIIGNAIVSQATIYNSSKAKSPLIYDRKIQQNITRSFQKYVPNMSLDDIEIMVNTLQTISKIAVKSMTPDEMIKMSIACASAFVNNALINGPVTTPRPKFIPTTQPNTYLPPDTTKTTSRIETSVPTRPSTTRVTETIQQRRTTLPRTYLPPETVTKFSCANPKNGNNPRCTTTTRAPTTPYASPWPSNQVLRKQISKAILESAGNLSVSDYQVLMDTSKDLYNHFQYWNSTQMLSLAPIIGNAIVSQATIYNSSKAKSPLIYDRKIQQNITRSFQKYVPNMSLDDIEIMVNTLQTISKIAVKSMTPDEMIKMSIACASAFVNNALVNEPVTRPRPKFIPTTQPNTYLPPDTTKTPNRIETSVPTRPSTTRVTETIQQRRTTLPRTYLPPETVTKFSCANPKNGNNPRCTTTTRAPTTPYASPWPSNQALRKQISEAILKFGENLSVSGYQGLMDASKDLNTFMQYWNSTQMSILTPFLGKLMVAQSVAHNSSNLPSSITYSTEVKQNITKILEQYAPNMSLDEIQFAIKTCEEMSTICLKYLTIDELNRMSHACASAFVNNTLINGPITTPRPTFIPTTQPNTYLPPHTTKPNTYLPPHPTRRI